jgi:hypothetical protein
MTIFNPLQKIFISAEYLLDIYRVNNTNTFKFCQYFCQKKILPSSFFELTNGFNKLKLNLIKNSEHSRNLIGFDHSSVEEEISSDEVFSQE